VLDVFGFEPLTVEDDFAASGIVIWLMILISEVFPAPFRPNNP
jgi:hypothetical protein